MRIFIFLLALVCAAALSAQENPDAAGKGATPLASAAHRPAAGVTRAVVIGISEYQDERIPDLQYAHRDAEAFADFLRSKAGGGLTEDQVMLLTNKKATDAQIYMALDWLLEETVEGDLAVIYFSGHGDAEVKLRTQRGFLLTHNSVAETPKIASIRLNELEDHIVEIALEKKARVLVITDACRSGMLAGREGGAKMANTELAAMSDKAVKILSCQPDEMSHEGTQWGGGRGAFSYFLVNGLYGLADQNSDRAVTLTEIGRYLEDNVSREVSPSSQIPKVVGSPKEKLTTVFPDELAKLRESLDPLAVHFKPAEQRGLEDETLARVDSATRAAYRQFKQAVAAKQFFEPADACADTLYGSLTGVAGLHPLFNTMKRNYAAALMDDAQEAMNGWLRSDPRETESWGTRRKEDYHQFPRQLARAAELLGEKHYLYNDLKAKEYFFRIRIYVVEVGMLDGKWDSLQLATLLDYVEAGLKYDSLAPYLYAKKAYYFLYRKDFKQCIAFFRKTIDLAPSWVWAYYQGYFAYRYTGPGNLVQAKELLFKAYQLDSTNFRVLEEMKDFYINNHRFDLSRSFAQKISEVLERQVAYQDLPDFWRANVYLVIGEFGKAETLYRQYLKSVWDSRDTQQIREVWPYYVQLGWALFFQEKQDEAEKWLLKSDSIQENPVALDGLFQIACKQGDNQLADNYLGRAIQSGYTPDWIVMNGLGIVALTGWGNEVILLFSKAVNHFPDHAPLHYHLARLYLEQKNDYEKGLPLLERAVLLDSIHPYYCYHLAAASAHLGRNDAALAHLEKALENGYEDWEELAKDARWEGLRGTERYEKVVGRYRVGKD